MSRAETTPSSRSRSAPPWIVGFWQDLLFFVATPLLIVPLAQVSRSHFSVADIGLFVASFGAVGHHLPGMMRAYGDRALFERFRTRFILSPLFLLAVSVYFTFQDLHGLTVIVLLWGVWHGALQVYGFVRIYDAKAKSFAPRTVRLDWLMCIVWFGAGVVFSPGRMVSIFEAFYRSGGPLIATDAFRQLQVAWAVATALVTAAFVVHFASEWLRGRGVSFLKPVTMATSFGFWWYASVAIPQPILGVALFEIFHDVQYLAIVWLFNRNRATKDPGAGGFTRLLFQRSGVMVGLYVGLCFAYGGLRLLPEATDQELVKRALLGVVTASTLLHFYFDGFIWKVREKTTREGLGLKGGGSAVVPAPAAAPWMVHGLKWSAFVIPIAVLAVTQIRGAEPTLAQYQSMAALVPRSAYVHNNLGVQLKARGELEEAIRHYETAVAIDPGYARAHSNLGAALLGKQQMDEAVRHLRRAVSLEPDYAEAHTNLGSALARRNKTEEAIRRYRTALEHDPNLVEAHNGLGQQLAREKRFDEAIGHFERAVELGPEFADLHSNLGLTLMMAGRRDEALAAFERSLELKPDYLVPLESASWILATRPDGSPEDAERAVELGERAAELTSYMNASVLDTLGTAYASAGDLDRAAVAARTASALASEAGYSSLVRDIEARIELYQKGRAYREEGGARK